MAKLIDECGIGIKIGSLSEILGHVAALVGDGYLSLRQKAVVFGKQLRAGEIVNGLG